MTAKQLAALRVLANDGNIEPWVQANRQKAPWYVPTWKQAIELHPDDAKNKHYRQGYQAGYEGEEFEPPRHAVSAPQTWMERIMAALIITPFDWYYKGHLEGEFDSDRLYWPLADLVEKLTVQEAQP